MKFAFGALLGSVVTAAIGVKIAGVVLQNPRVQIAIKDATAAAVERALYGDVTFASPGPRPRFTTVR